MGISKIIYGIEKCLFLGNIYSYRDWGHARDYIEMCWKVLQHKKPDDFVIATEKQYNVKYFINECFKYLDIKIKWSGRGLNEYAKITDFNFKKYPNLKKNMKIIKISKKYFRPNEVENLIGNASKAKKIYNGNQKFKLNN